MEQNKQTVVFVDDDKVQHMINKRIFKKMDNKVKMVFFENPYEALDWLGSNSVHLILLDINMPEMDGWSFLKCMEAKGIKADVKMLTGILDPDYLDKSKEFKQISGFLIKPLKEANFMKLLAD